MSDFTPMQFLIRASSHIAAKAYTTRHDIEEGERWIGRAKTELAELDAIRAQILVVAQKMEGATPTLENIALGNTASSQIDRDLFAEVVENLNIDAEVNAEVEATLSKAGIKS